MNFNLSKSASEPNCILSADLTKVVSQNGFSIESAKKIANLDSAVLLQGQKVIQIEHNGAVYRLQATKLGKLILTK